MGTSVLRAEFRLQSGRTVLGDAFFTPPMKLAKPFPVDGRPAGAAVVVMEASPGMLAGDRYEMDWSIGSGARAAATTQSYAKVHPCPAGGAVQTIRIAVGEGASFIWVPQPMQLHADASFRGSVQAELASGASLMLLDTLGAGRIHHAGEAFRFRLFEQEVTVSVEGRIALASRVRYAPAEQSPGAPGAFGGDTHVGTLFGFGAFADQGAVETVLAAAERRRGVRAGASLLDHGGLAAVVLGSAAWDVHRTLVAMGRELAAIAGRRASDGCAPFAWTEWP